MSFPSFEETNNPGYDDFFRKNNEPKISWFQRLGEIILKPSNPQIDSLLQEDSIVEVFKLVNEGHRLSRSQKDSVVQKMCQQIDIHSNVLEKALSQGIDIPNEYLIDFVLHKNATFCFDVKSFMYKSDSEQKYPCKCPRLKEVFEEKYQQASFRREIFLAWYQMLKDVVNDKVAYRSMKNPEDFFLMPDTYFEYKVWNPINIMGRDLWPTATLNEYIDSLRLLNNVPEVSKNIDKHHKVYCKQNSPRHSAKQAAWQIERQGYFHQRIHPEQSIEAKIELPQSCQQTLKKIKELYVKLQRDINILAMKDQFEIANIYEKHLPQTMSQYHDIHQQYRSVEMDGKNPEKILEKSLSDIEEIFTQKLTLINQARINQLDISSRYIGELKRKMT